jgi:hemolysin activation/secretion protein
VAQAGVLPSPEAAPGRGGGAGGAIPSLPEIAPAPLPQPRTVEQNLTLGLSLEYRQAQTFLLGMPFSFTNGAKNGNTNVTPLRFSQDWLDRDAEHAFAARSTLSFGLPIFGATVESGAATTAQFFSWFGQAQYMRRVFADWEVLARTAVRPAGKGQF